MFLSFSLLDYFFRFKFFFGFLCILGPPYCGIGATISTVKRFDVYRMRDFFPLFFYCAIPLPHLPSVWRTLDPRAITRPREEDELRCHFRRGGGATLPAPGLASPRMTVWSQRAIFLDPKELYIREAILNTPSVAGAFTQTPLSLADSIIDSMSERSFCGNIFKTLSLPNRKSWEDEILTQCSPLTTWNM